MIERAYGASQRKPAPMVPRLLRRRHDSGPRPAAVAPLVLIVDDDEDSRELYSTFFAQAGLRVSLAVDGEHALLKVMSLKPDLIITDLSMPILDGWTAVRELKTHPMSAHIPVIVLTGRVAPENLDRAREAGADAVLTKPCEPSNLFELVLRLLPTTP